MNLYVSTGGEVLGPYSETDVRSMVLDGSYPRDVLVCPEGKNDWTPYNERTPTRRPSTPVKETTGGEHVYYQGAGVTVTNSRFIVGQQTYVMRNITSVKPFRVSPSRLLPVLLLIVGGFFLLAGVSQPDGAAVIILGLVVGLPGVLMLALQTTKHSVVLTTAGGEVRALEDTDEKLIGKIVNALNAAIIAQP